MAGNDGLIGIGIANKDDYRKVNVDARNEHAGGEGGDIITSRLPAGADAGVLSLPSATQEVYTFKRGGVAGTTVAILTLNYVDATKAVLLDFAWT